MSNHHNVQGSCSCGRNRYVIHIPETHATSASVYFDNTSRARRSHATPLQAFLAVPLEWYHSSTIAYLPDETHTSIRRTYHTTSLPPSSTPIETTSNDSGEAEHQHTQKTFCGYCGTPLSTWSDESSAWEQPAGARESHPPTPAAPSAPTHPADWIAVTLGSLLDEHMPILDELGILPADDDEIDEENDQSTNDEAPRRTDQGAQTQPTTTTTTTTTRTSTTRTSPHDTTTNVLRTTGGRGIPWFEELVEDSGLGRIRKKRGGHTTANERVEWEVVELGGNGNDVAGEGAGSRTTTSTTTKKRKAGADDVADAHAHADDAPAQSEDVEMRSM
ncbi:MAG: hypothetical protein M1831_006896 [Alyxoria varia]|nr:MAG: hypothetical protein M1831_006896 [Alyxoria varia]